jgi:hypothetical protein
MFVGREIDLDIGALPNPLSAVKKFLNRRLLSDPEVNE